MSNAVEDYLKSHGPSLSSEVSKHLVEALNMAPDAARKRISRAVRNRASGKVRSLAHITFPHRARFIYLQHQQGSQAYWKNLIRKLLRTNSAYGLAVAALYQRGGLIPVEHFAIVCGSPLKQRRHLSPDTILERLENGGLLQRINMDGLGEWIALASPDEDYRSMVAYVRARLTAEKFLLFAVKDWLKRLGIVSYHTVKIRGAGTRPEVGTFAWDLSAASYLDFMLKPDKEGGTKPGFVACDVYLGSIMNPEGVKPFINKCVTLRALRNIGACMQILVADKYTQDAFNLLKQRGVIPATPRNLFGEEVAEGLTALLQVLRKAAETAIDPERLDQLFNRLGKIEGASSQLRGTLFEYLVKDMLRKNGSTEVRMNRVFRSDDGREAEADVIAIKENKSVTFVECKGYNPDSEVPDSELKRWLQRSVPIFFKHIKSHPDWRNLKICFEFWTTGLLSDAALEMFRNAQKNIRKSRYKIKLRLGDQILEICESTNDSGLVTAFRKHFMKIYSE